VSLYDAECPACGLVEVFTFKMVDGPLVDCNDCGSPSKKVFLQFPQIDTDCFETPGIGGAGPFYSKQLDTQFPSKKAYKAALKANGMREISKGSREGKKLVDKGRRAAAQVASSWGEDSRAGLASLKKAQPHSYAHRHDEENISKKAMQAKNLKDTVQSGGPKTLTAKDFA
tara:strand:- start:3126 stop:3638 length:513 start_codon:yes stop_codon:yes gene_type:complete